MTDALAVWTPSFIKKEIGDFLRETLKLEMPEAKTLVTHAKTEKAHFLGYEVGTLMANHVKKEGRRSINGQLGLRVPREVVERKSKPSMRRGKPVHRTEMLNDSDYQIIELFSERVPRAGKLLEVGLQPEGYGETQMGDGAVAGENTRGQAQNLKGQNVQEISGQGHRKGKGIKSPSSNGGKARKRAAYRTMGRNLTSQGHTGTPQRPPQAPLEQSNRTCTADARQ